MKSFNRVVLLLDLPVRGGRLNTNGSPFRCYLDISDKYKDLAGIPRLVCSMESLHYLQHASKFDLLVVDECQANLSSHVCAETNGPHHDLNIDVFRHLLNNSSQIVFADAFLGPKTITFLHNYGLPTLVLDYQRKMTPRIAVKCVSEHPNDLDALFETLSAAIDRDEKNYVFISSKNRLERWAAELKHRFPDKNFLSYAGGRANELRDVREAWTMADSVLTTSCITVGVNFDLRGVFSNIFICATAAAKNLVADIFQSHYRVRHPSKLRLYYHLYTQPMASLNTNFRTLRDDVEWREEVLMQRSRTYVNSPLAIRNLVAYCEFEQNMAIMNLQPLFERYLAECNYSIGDPLVIHDLADIKINADSYIPFNQIPIIDGFIVRKYQKRLHEGDSLSDIERISVSRYFFTRCFYRNGIAYIDSTHAEWFWDVWLGFKRQKIYAIRNERRVREGRVSVKELFELSADRNGKPCLATTSYLQLEQILLITEQLGLKTSQDTETVIPRNIIERTRIFLDQRSTHLRKCFDLRDRRKDKDVGLTTKDTISLINSVLGSFGMTRLVKHGPAQVRNGHKLMPNPDPQFKLQTQLSHEPGLGDLMYNAFDFSHDDFYDQSNP